MLSLEGFGLAGKPAAAAAAGAILYYVRSTQRGTLDHVDRIGFYERQNCLVLDAVTVRNLELIEPLFAGADAGVTLFRSIDATVTPMGKRLLRSWMLRPSIDRGRDQRAAGRSRGAGKRNLIAREELRRALEGILDLERLLSRVTLETANPRDVLALAASLGKHSGGARAGAVRMFAQPQRSATTLHATRVDELADLRERIEKTIVPEPPISLSDGGVIQPGVDTELDELRDLSRNSKQFLAQIEQRERQRTGISSLKVKFNSIFGYYLEISKPNLHLVPPDYERKQTLVNAERFTTPELKEYEVQDSRCAGEDRRDRAPAVCRIALGDCRRSPAHPPDRAGAGRSRCARGAWPTLRPCATIAGPRFDDSADIEIVAGRHPVIEQQELAAAASASSPTIFI